MKQFFLHFILLLIILLGAISCKESSKPELGSIVGRIQLDGQSDNSGIDVRVYTAGVVPEKLSNIYNTYPQLAFPVSDRIYFDHREYSPIKTVITNRDGLFSLAELPFGIYIVSYSKEGWGYNYIYDLVLNQSELNLSSKYDIQLFPEQQIPVFIDGDYTFETGKCYIANSNVSFGPNAQIEFQGNTRLLLGPNVKISSYGSLSFPTGQEMAYITSFSGAYTGNIQNQSRADGLEIVAGTLPIHNICLSHLYNALMIRSANIEVSRSAFRESVFGLLSNSTSNISISGCVFANNIDINGAASYCYYVNQFDCGLCVFYNNYMAMKNEIVKEAIIENNLFIDNNHSYLNLWESTAVFQHNNINSEGVGVENSGMSNLEIYYNNIAASTCVQTYHSNNWYNTVNYGWTKAHNNNFLPVIYAMESRAAYYYSDGPYPLDFTNNYWNTPNAGTIDSYIIDFNDLGLVVGSGVSSIVNYVPYRQNAVPNAGIQIR